MKLAIITGSVSRAAGGTFDAIRRPIALLAEQYGVECRVIGTRDAYTEQDQPAWLPLIPETFAVKGLRSFGYSPRFAHALATFQSDLQHVHGIWMYYSLVNFQYYKRFSKPYIVSPHGMLDQWAVQHSGWKKRLVSALFEGRHLSGAHCLHALCEAEALVMRGFGLKNVVCIIPNGVDIPAEVTEVPAPWQSQINEGKKVLLFLGRIHPKKGLPALLEAWRHIQAGKGAATGWALAIAGWDQGGHEATLRAYAQDYSMEGSVVFLGSLFGEAKQAALTNAAAFILPSLSEGLPMTVLEAWANRLPVLMTPACNLPVGFERGAALTITPDRQGIVAGLRTLLDMNSDDRQEMGRKGYTLVTERFTWEKVAGQFYEVYKWLLGGGTLPASMWPGN